MAENETQEHPTFPVPGPGVTADKLPSSDRQARLSAILQNPAARDPAHPDYARLSRESLALATAEHPEGTKPPTDDVLSTLGDQPIERFIDDGAHPEDLKVATLVRDMGGSAPEFRYWKSEIERLPEIPEQQRAANRTASVSMLQGLWGGEYASKLDEMEGFISRESPELYRMLSRSGWGSHPGFVRWLADTYTKFAMTASVQEKVDRERRNAPGRR